MSDGPTTGPSAGPTTGPTDGHRALTGDVLRHSNRVHQFLSVIDASDLADRIRDEAERWKDASLTAVVAGDIKRGKSSLLNAFVGHPGLLPVDADVATSVHLVLRHGPQLTVRVTRTDDDGVITTEEVPPSQLLHYASMQGDPARREGVSDVEVTLDHPLLARGLVLVDTPGVGGMTRGHRDTTMAALRRADVLLFVISAQEPVARTELEFLAEASQRIDHVVFLVAKADLNTDDVNRRLVEENRAKLAAFREILARRAEEEAKEAKEAGAAPDTGPDEILARFDRLLRSPYLLTSSLLADQARRRAEADRHEQAERYRERSGFAALEGMLAHSIAKREDVRLANVCQVVNLVLDEAGGRQQARLRAAEGDSGIEADVAARQEALEQLGSKQARWRTSLGNNMQRLQASLNRVVAKELNLVRGHYRDVLEKTTDVEQLALSLPDDLDRSLRAAWNNLSATANAELQSVVDALVAELDVDDVRLVVEGLATPPDVLDALNRVSGPSRDFSLLDDGVPLAMQTFTFANIANAAGGLLGVATGGLGLVAYGIGAGLSFGLTKLRKQGRERSRTLQEYTRMINDALFGQDGMAKEFQTELSLRVIDARETIESVVDERLTQRRRQLERESRELSALLRSETASRTEQRARATKALAEVGELRQRTAGLHAAVRQSLSS